MNVGIFYVNGKFKENQWKVFKNIEIQIEPIVVHFCDSIFEQIYLFLWSSDLLGQNEQEQPEEI